MKHLSLTAFTESVASKEPIPGGGSVSAHSGAQSAALLAMYCRLSLGKPMLEEVQQLFDDMLQESETIAEVLLNDIEHDSDAFRAVVGAFKLPKGNDDEKAKRSTAIQEAFTHAARVPLEVASRCLRLLEMIHVAAGQGNNNAITDIGVGNLLAWAGLQGALYNVRINLGSLKDQTLVKELNNQAGRIHNAGDSLYKKTSTVVEALIGQVR
jgi:formiminotetrahydrofolate cyclodeaminase